MKTAKIGALLLTLFGFGVLQSASAQLAFTQSAVIQQSAGVYFIFEATEDGPSALFQYINLNTGQGDYVLMLPPSSDGTFSGTSPDTGRTLSGKISGSTITLNYSGVTVSGTAIPTFGAFTGIAGHYSGTFENYSAILTVFANGAVEYFGRNGYGVGSIDSNNLVSLNLTTGEFVSFVFSPAFGTSSGSMHSSFNGNNVSYGCKKTDIKRLVNISTRAFVQGGSHTLIAGFIVQDGIKAVLIRGIGPSLSAGGVPDPLQNPRLDIFQGQTLIASNADWKTNGNASEIQASGIPPSNDKEAALLISLAPGAYTAQVSSEDGGQGVALVEVYDIK